MNCKGRFTSRNSNIVYIEVFGMVCLREGLKGMSNVIANLEACDTFVPAFK